MHQAYETCRQDDSTIRTAGSRQTNSNSAGLRGRRPTTREASWDALQSAQTGGERVKAGKLNPTSWMPFSPSHCGVLPHSPRALTNWTWLSLHCESTRTFPKVKRMLRLQPEASGSLAAGPSPSTGCHQRTSLWLAQEEKIVLVVPGKNSKNPSRA